jgi:hypothetical protein
MTKLQLWMESATTMPELQEALITRLRQWKGLTRHNPTWTTLHGLRHAVGNQDELGWYNFLMGRISIEWKAVQQRYYDWLGKRNTGRKWAVALIQKIFEVSWDMWDHRNEVRLNTITPAKARRIHVLNARVKLFFQQLKLSRQKAAKILKAATMSSTVHPAHALISLHVNWIRIV